VATIFLFALQQLFFILLPEIYESPPLLIFFDDEDNYGSKDYEGRKPCNGLHCIDYQLKKCAPSILEVIENPIHDAAGRRMTYKRLFYADIYRGKTRGLIKKIYSSPQLIKYISSS
jgi:hypothetical protein